MENKYIATSTFYEVVDRTCRAINRSRDIGYCKFPETLEACEELSQEWAFLSGPHHARGLIRGCVGGGGIGWTSSPDKKTKQV